MPKPLPFPADGLLLAPMAGVTDAPFRALCVACGASGAVGEMVSAKAVTLGDQISLSLASRGGQTGPYGIQIFSSDPADAYDAVRRLDAAHPDADWFDLNAGCPAPKIVRGGCGSALMRDPSLIETIVTAMRRATDKPVTVKMRAGFDADHVNAVDCARAAEAGGADAVTVHGRTRDRMYAPPVDRAVIAAVNAAVSVPVVANGDIFTVDDARAMRNETGCTALMIGRGALGRPWFFASLAAFLQTGERLPDPSSAEKMALLLRHIEALAAFEGEKTAVMKARKHAAWYTKGIRGAAALRREMNTLATLDDLRALAQKAASLPAGDAPFTPPQAGNFA